MTPTEFTEQNTTFAKDQPEYNPLPAHCSQEGVVTTRWKLSQEELKHIERTGEIWLQVYTFRQPLQPLRLSVLKPEIQP